MQSAEVIVWQRSSRWAAALSRELSQQGLAGFELVVCQTEAEIDSWLAGRLAESRCFAAIEIGPADAADRLEWIAGQEKRGHCVPIVALLSEPHGLLELAAREAGAVAVANSTLRLTRLADAIIALTTA